MEYQNTPAPADRIGEAKDGQAVFTPEELQFLAWENSTKDVIDVKRIYVDITGDLVAGIMLSQLVFWWLPNKKGEPKLSIERDGRFWLAKGREEWWEECRIAPRQADRAIELLERKNFVVKRVWKHLGNTTVHLSINIPEIHQSVNRELRKAQIANHKPHRFAAFVVGEFRDSKGYYRNFVGDTVTAFTDAGFLYYNEAILVTAVGSLPIRCPKQFSASRKFGKTHQNVLVFVKGDARKAADNAPLSR